MFKWLFKKSKLRLRNLKLGDEFKIIHKSIKSDTDVIHTKESSTNVSSYDIYTGQVVDDKQIDPNTEVEIYKEPDKSKRPASFNGIALYGVLYKERSNTHYFVIRCMCGCLCFKKVDAGSVDTDLNKHREVTRCVNCNSDLLSVWLYGSLSSNNRVLASNICHPYGEQHYVFTDKKRIKYIKELANSGVKRGYMNE